MLALHYGAGWALLIFGFWFWLVAWLAHMSGNVPRITRFITGLGFLTVVLGVWMFAAEWYLRPKGMWPL